MTSLTTNLSLTLHVVGQLLEQQAESQGAAYMASIASYVVGQLTVSQPLPIVQCKDMVVIEEAMLLKLEAKVSSLLV